MLKLLRALLFGVSVGLHLLIFLSIPRVRFEAPKMSVVELTETPQTKTQPTASSRSSHATVRDSKIETKSAKTLTFAPSFHPRGDLEIGTPEQVSGEIVDDPSSQWGSGGADFERVSDLGRFDRLYELIDSHVMYPSVLAYHQISGTVNARLILTPEGTCDWHSTTIRSTQSHLRLYVLDVLKRVCGRDLKRFARQNSNSNLDLSFRFAITEHDDESLKAREKKIVGNVFLFYRNSQASIAEWHLGPFHGIFPVPVVALDFAWLQENYDRVMHSRDPLEEFRSHLSDSEPES